MIRKRSSGTITDINVYQSNLFHTRMLLKEVDLQNYLFNTDIYELPPKTRLKIHSDLRRDDRDLLRQEYLLSEEEKRFAFVCGRTLCAPTVTSVPMVNRRGEQCAPTQRKRVTKLLTVKSFHYKEGYIMDQSRAPIMEALENFKDMRIVPFDVPGHKRGRGSPELTKFLGQQCMTVDVNSMKPLDNLCHPTSVIREAEELAADAFGAAHAFLMVGGTTSSVQAMIRGKARRRSSCRATYTAASSTRSC